jgi:Uma2 family endonuclease
MLTVEDHPYLYEDLRRHEIINGEHFQQTAGTPCHQRIVANLLLALHGLPGEVFTYVGVVLSNNDLVIPDFLFIAPERLRKIGKQYIECAPDLIAEVMSDETRHVDEVIKRHAYDRCGVAEYWAVDPELELVKINRRSGRGRYERVAELSTETGGSITSPLLPNFSLDIAAVFQVPR